MGCKAWQYNALWKQYIVVVAVVTCGGKQVIYMYEKLKKVGNWARGCWGAWVADRR